MPGAAVVAGVEEGEEAVAGEEGKTAAAAAVGAACGCRRGQPAGAAVGAAAVATVAQPEGGAVEAVVEPAGEAWEVPRVAAAAADADADAAAAEPKVTLDDAAAALESPLDNAAAAAVAAVGAEPAAEEAESEQHAPPSADCGAGGRVSRAVECPPWKTPASAREKETKWQSNCVSKFFFIYDFILAKAEHSARLVFCL